MVETLITPVRSTCARRRSRRIREGVSWKPGLAIKIHAREGRLTGIECVRNRLGEVYATGRRTPGADTGERFSVWTWTPHRGHRRKALEQGSASMGIEATRAAG
jgi:hypothetical protein